MHPQHLILLIRHRYCFAPDGDEVQVLVEAEESTEEQGHTEEDHDHDHDHTEEAPAESAEDPSGQRHCHFHAGVQYVNPILLLSILPTVSPAILPSTIRKTLLRV